MTQTATQQCSYNRRSTNIQKESVARTIEEQTAKLPSDIFLWGALGSIGLSLYFELKGEAQKSSFRQPLGFAFSAARRLQQTGEITRFRPG